MLLARGKNHCEYNHEPDPACAGMANAVSPPAFHITLADIMGYA